MLTFFHYFFFVLNAAINTSRVPPLPSLSVVFVLSCAAAANADQLLDASLPRSSSGCAQSGATRKRRKCVQR